LICPVCFAKKLTGPVYSLGRTFSDLPMTASGPDDGLPHFHDPSSSIEAFECINGHRFKVETQVLCPQCDHGHEPPRTIMLEPRSRFRPRRVV
jgi:hypothetical protein